MKILRHKVIWLTLGYALVATVMTYPLLFQLDSGVVSQSADAWILVWGNWWIPHALTTGQNIFFTPLMFYPNGVSLASHSFSFTHTVISAVFQLFTNPVAAYNLGIWLIFPVSALSMYALAKYVVHSDAAAWLAGLIYAFAPYHMTQALGHPHLSYVQFIPLGVLFTLKAIDAPRTRYLAGAIICFALTAYAGPHLLVVAFTWLAIFLPFDFIAQRRRVRVSTLARFSCDWPRCIDRVTAAATARCLRGIARPIGARAANGRLRQHPDGCGCVFFAHATTPGLRCCVGNDLP